MGQFTAEILLDLDETAQTLRVSSALVRKLIRQGELPAIKIGTRRVVPGWALDEFLRQREAEAGIVRPSQANAR